MDKFDRYAFASLAFVWPALAAVAAGALASNMAKSLTLAAGSDAEPLEGEPQWATRNRIVLELSTVRLRDFSARRRGIPTLLCAPFALHASNIVDFAPGHSLVETLIRSVTARVFVTDWRSATAEMRFFSIDTYLADLNVLIDHLGGTVDLVGVCQGGWLALLYAARFPGKVRKLVLAAAPIDLEAGESDVAKLANDTPLAVFESMVELGDGRVRGQHMLQFWGRATPDRTVIRDVLQLTEADDSPAFRRLEARFRNWHTQAVDLPGTYYLQVVERLFKGNQLAAGRFVALGSRVDLASVRCPLYLLAARDDEVVTVQQLLATENLVGTSREDIFKEIAATSHLGLFMGRTVLAEHWSRVAQWLAGSCVNRSRLVEVTANPSAMFAGAG